MSDVNQSEDGAVREAGAQKSGVSRRHLVRAGLSAAPVLAALKSNTVLAGGDTLVLSGTTTALALAEEKLLSGKA